MTTESHGLSVARSRPSVPYGANLLLLLQQQQQQPFYGRYKVTVC